MTLTNLTYHLPRGTSAWLCMLTGAFVLLNTVSAAELYKYQDEEGIWHYSDQPPAGESAPRPASADTTPSQQQVVIHRLGKEEAPVFEVSNTLSAPIEIKFWAEQIQNMSADPPLPIHKIIPAGSREPLTRFEIINPDAPWSYAYRTRFVPGDPNAKHLSGKPYLPPFPEYKEFTISQAFDGERSHKQHTLTRYGVDIAMPAGSSVNAARSGIMLDAKFGKLSPKQKHKTFYVRVLHRDGTFGIYANLAPESIKLQPGMTINRGQVIGLLSKSQDDSPYLHFAVQKNTGMKLESIPFEFAEINGGALEPKTGQVLRHPL